MLNGIFEKIFHAAESDQKSIEQLMMKLTEECGELAQALLSYTGAPGCSYKKKTLDDVIEEVVDCVINSGAILKRVSNGKVDEELFTRTLNKKLSKWVEKCSQENPATHWDEAKIQ